MIKQLFILCFSLYSSWPNVHSLSSDNVTTNPAQNLEQTKSSDKVATKQAKNLEQTKSSEIKLQNALVLDTLGSLKQIWHFIIFQQLLLVRNARISRMISSAPFRYSHVVRQVNHVLPHLHKDTTENGTNSRKNKL